jgi:hypothetical protein
METIIAILLPILLEKLLEKCDDTTAKKALRNPNFLQRQRARRAMAQLTDEMEMLMLAALRNAEEADLDDLLGAARAMQGSKAGQSLTVAIPRKK